MRRLGILVALLGALLSASPGSAALEPIRRPPSEAAPPLVRAGTVRIPQGQAAGRVRVIVRLAMPPLARAYPERSLAAAGLARRLDAASVASRAYLTRLAAAQRAAEAQLTRTIPEARVVRRYRIVLNGLAVSVPAHRLPRLVRMRLATRVYPSLRYTVATNESPSIISAPAFWAATGARGDGVRIGIVDDGIDPQNPFFDPAGFAYPAGFPRGGARWTTPKIIVARAFPGPNAGRRGRLALDRRASFHGTHVAGIAAGIAGTRAVSGPDHPAVEGLSGVAPRAWLGNYRVFTVPTPIGHVANTPEIVAAFEAAVRDGMDVVNFSGGGPQTDPANDAMVETIANVSAAGVVPVISAGNDRDEFGFGSAGSPGTAPEAISVAAVSNRHVFAPILRVTGGNVPASLAQVAFQPGGIETPRRWATEDQTLVDVGSIVGRNRRPVDRKLCGPPVNPNGGRSQLPRRVLRGTIALVWRGDCTFASKAARASAAGAVGMVLVSNRPGEASGIPVALGFPAGMIADLDGERLRAYLAGTGGRTAIRIGRTYERIETGRSGVLTYFSSAGPTAFGHALKPDLAAPGGAILSSTLPQFATSPFAVFDGTSMAAPHVAGAVGLLRQLRPGWTPRQLKSALVSTAATAWEDTARTRQAPVTMAGGGLADVVAAMDPRVFSEPASLSFGDLDVTRGAARRGLLLFLEDAGGGAGTWQVDLRPQSAGAGALLDVPGTVAVPPGGTVALPVVALAATGAEASDNYGFLVLRRGSVERRIPYLFLVTRPKLAGHTPRPLRRLHSGTTARGSDLVRRYRFPTAPFGAAPDYTGPPMDEGGAETVYSTRVDAPAVNLGAAILAVDGSALVHPWLLGSLDENDVQGYAGTPVNVNSLTLDYRIDYGAAGAVFPRQQRFYVSVDSGSDPFTGRQFEGRYLLRSWLNDVRPPRLRLVTRRVTAGRPLVIVRVRDAGSGVDPYSLVLAYRRVLLGAAAYDPFSGLALFALPPEAPGLRPGKTPVVLVGSDFQEGKNVNTVGDDVMPNTRFQAVRITATRKPVVTWLRPESGSCVRGRVRLLVAAGSGRKIANVRFLDGRRTIRVVRRDASGLYATNWRARGRGRHRLHAVVRDVKGRTARAGRAVRVCR